MLKHFVVISVCLVAVIGVAQAEEEPQFPTPKLQNTLEGVACQSESTLKDQQDVAVTVYNNDLALVRDKRKIVMLPGEISLKFADVAQQIKPETVSLRSLTEPAALRVLEQNYEFDLMSPNKLLEKYVGKQVRLVNFSTQVNFGEKDATLLSTNEGPIYKVDNEIYLGFPGQVVLPKIPENLIAKPSLVWLLDNKGTDHEVEVTYLTGGIEWRADYVVTLDRNDSKMNIEGWVTLNNKSGAQYTNAQLKLVAGEVNVVQPELDFIVNGVMTGAAACPPPPMREESFAEYHLYSLLRRTTIKQNESKQVSLLTAAGIGVQKIFEYRGNEGFYSQPIPPQKEEKVGVFLKFVNKKDNQLGMPLPGGIMRVYQEDTDGMLQFAGEDQIKHTPKDEEVRLRLGNAFDIIGERIQTDFQEIADNIFESAYEIKVRNHKESDVTVDIVEPMPGDWTILSQSQQFTKKDAHTAVFSVSVPKDGEVVVTYRVRVKN